MAEENYGLSVLDQNELKSIESEIRAEYEKVEMTARDAMIAMGGLLDEARKLIDDDQLFGAWRKDNTPFESKENANKAMQLHRAVGDGRISQTMLDSKMGQSHLLEIKDASITVQADVEKLIAKGNIPTIKNLRDMKKAAAPIEDKKGGAETGGSTATPAKKEEPSYGNGYKDTGEETVSRTKAEQYGDILGLVEQLLDEEIMPLTADAHKLATESLNDSQRATQVNDLRRSLKDLQEGLAEMIKFADNRG